MVAMRIRDGLTALAVVALVCSLQGRPLWGQAVKPQLSALPDSVPPRGCSTTLDDWRGSQLLWAPPTTSPKSSDQAEILIAVDGAVRRLAINSRSSSHLSATEGTYSVDIRTPTWKRVDMELSQARATLTLRNTRTNTDTRVILRASQGC
jgi:hypothetical protein